MNDLPAIPSALVEAAAYAMAGRVPEDRHSQRCPVWTHRGSGVPMKACDCWVLRRAFDDARAGLAAALAECEVVEQWGQSTANTALRRLVITTRAYPEKRKSDNMATPENDPANVIKRELWARLDEVMAPTGSMHQTEIGPTTLGDWLGDRVFAALIEAGLLPITTAPASPVDTPREDSRP